MQINEALDLIYESKNESELFDSLCKIQNFIENNGYTYLFEEKISDKGERFSIIKNEFTITHISRIFENQYFRKSILSSLKFQKEYGELKNVPEKILRDGSAVNLFVNCSFYFIAAYSKNFKYKNIAFIGKMFWDIIKNLEKDFSYEFNKVDILNTLESIIFDKQYFFQKDFCCELDGVSFYNNLKKSRLIIGHYLIDFSIPILLSNSFKKIMSVKANVGSGFSSKDSVNRLQSVLRKYQFLKEGFKFGDLNEDNLREISPFKYYFEIGESKKILFLLNEVVEGLNEFTSENILNKIDNSANELMKIKKYFFENYNIFPEYKGPKIEAGQWSNKSFLNTIKLFTLLDVSKNSLSKQWKIDIFLKYFNDWIIDLNDNINYFSELDDYDKISKLLIISENNLIEYKSTFGLPIQECSCDEESTKVRRDIMEKIAKTILAMANSEGGNILIGVVEKTDRISEEIRQKIVSREGFNFFDINLSLKMEKSDFDSKRLTLQQTLKNLTKERLDYLDSLFSMRFYKIYIEDLKSCIEILCIEVIKANKILYIRKDDSWISLPKRLNGRVELIDPSSNL